MPLYLISYGLDDFMSDIISIICNVPHYGLIVNESFLNNLNATVTCFNLSLGHYLYTKVDKSRRAPAIK